MVGERILPGAERQCEIFLSEWGFEQSFYDFVQNVKEFKQNV